MVRAVGKIIRSREILEIFLEMIRELHQINLYLVEDGMAIITKEFLKGVTLNGAIPMFFLQIFQEMTETIHQIGPLIPLAQVQEED